MMDASEEDEMYGIGYRDGYESAIQDLDHATGGDGEFKGSTVPGGTVDVPTMKQRVVDRFKSLEKLVYVPGQWRCPKCDFRLSQMTLYAANGAVGPNDTPGEKCPNCNGPLWRVSAMDDRNEAFKCANDTFDRLAAAQRALQTAVDHIEHMAAWVGKQQAGYSFESLGEDMPSIKAQLPARDTLLAKDGSPPHG